MKRNLLLISAALIALTLTYITKRRAPQISQAIFDSVKAPKSRVVKKVETDKVKTKQAAIKKIKSTPIPSDQKRKLYKSLMELTGVQKGSTTKLIKAALAKQEKLSDELKSFLEKYDYDTNIEDAITSEFSAEELEDLIAFNQEEVVKKANEANKELMNDPKVMMEMQDYIASFDEKTIAPERQKAVSEVIESSDAIELAKTSVENSIRTSVMTAVDGSYEEKNEKYLAVKKQYQENLKKNPGQFEKQIKAAMYYSLRGLNNDELKEYAALQSKYNLKRFNRQSSAATGKAMGKLFKEMAKIMKKSKKQTKKM